jgi:hypothetical protein
MSYKQFPAQKKAMSMKTKAWMKACIDGAEAMAIYRDEGIRKSYKTKKINYNLYSDILDQDDVKKIVDPLGLDNSYTPAKMQNYPIINPKVDLLWGEETKRRFDWRLRTINDDAISEKETDLNEQLTQLIVEQMKSEATSEEDLQKRLSEFEHYRNYTYQDKREEAGTWILKHLWEEQGMKMKLDKGFKDALIAGEEIYQWDIVAGQPVLLKHNPLNVHTVRSGESPYIEDAEIIVIDSYYAPGKIIDEYNEYLTPSEIDQIEKRSLNSTGLGESSYPDATMDRRDMVDNTIDTAIFETNLNEHSAPFDSNGNVRVTKVYWKSMRKMQKVKYYDEFGDEQSELMPEQYVVDKDKGEESKVIWISEWWEGHKIASGNLSEDGIYVKMQVRPVQYRRMENPSLCYPGIIGTIYNTNDNVAMSFYDRMKPYQYMYNALMYNVELALSTNWGKILKLDVTQVPDGWDVEKWMSYAKYLKIAPIDPFKEGKKGAALGKISGNLQSSNANPVIDMSQGNAIQLYIMMMEHIKQEVGEIVGVSKAREGSISPSSTSGNVQREVVQSSHITEYYFAEHADVKKRVLATGLETAKLAWGESKTKKLQFVTNDMATKMISVDMEDIRSIDFDMHISNSRDDQELLENMKQLAHAGIQNDKITFSELMDIYNSDSLSAIRRKIEKGEANKTERDQKQAEQAERMQSEQIQAAAQEKEKERAHDFDLEVLKGQNAVTLEQLKAQLKTVEKGFDGDKDGIRDDVEIVKTQMQKDAESLENEKARNHEASENAKDRYNKKELERIKLKNKAKPK